MRKTLKIIFFIFTIIYLYRWLGSIKIYIDYITPTYWIFTIPYIVYESSHLIKDDKINGTHTFRNRLIIMAVGGLILILSSIYLNRIYQP